MAGCILLECVEMHICSESGHLRRFQREQLDVGVGPRRLVEGRPQG